MLFVIRFEDLFYETWTQGEDSMCRNDDGTLDYSPFKKEYSGGAGGSEIKAILLFRACKVKFSTRSRFLSSTIKLTDDVIPGDVP